MSDEHVHPSLDLLADHHERLLPAELAMRVNSHVVTCPACRGRLDALDGVAAMLRTEGSRRVSMPDDVANRVRQAITAEADQRARAIRPTTVPFPDRPESARAAQHRRRTPLLVAASTVAVLAVGGGAYTALSGGFGESNQGAAGKAPTSAVHSVGQTPDSGAHLTTLPQGANIPIATKKNIEQVAPLAITFQAPGAAQACIRAAVPAYDATRWAVGQVRFDGSTQWVMLDFQSRKGVVVDCSAGPTVTFRFGF